MSLLKSPSYCCCVFCWVALVALLTGPSAARALPDEQPSEASIVELQVHPTEMTLAGPRDQRTVLVIGRRTDGYRIDLTRQATYQSANPGIATVSEFGRVAPAGAGTTQLTVSAGGKTATVAVTVPPRPPQPPPISYTNEVEPVLSKGGCNMGACHGYSLGKNGFRLSLRGADPAFDHWSITEEFNGRRMNRFAPETSLLVAKPAGDLPHEGDVRFDKESESYRMLRRWLAEGAASDLDTAPRVTGIRVVPDYIVQPKPGMEQQLQVLASHSDGSTRDVTALAIYSSGTESVAEVDETGLVRGVSLGEAAISVRYERIYTVARVMVLKHRPDFVWTSPPENNFIDRHVFAKLKDMQTLPSELCSDAEFLRRVYLDTLGMQPTPAEVRAFVGHASSLPTSSGQVGNLPHDAMQAKRSGLIEELLCRPEFVDHWTMKWCDLLQVSRQFMPPESVWATREWIRHCVASNMPLDQLARELLTARGDVLENPAAAFYRVSTSPERSVERAVQVFAGIRMLCAKCHNHPFENWTQSDYYGVASFFNQMATKPHFARKDDLILLVNRDAGVATNPRSGKPQPARFLGGVEPQVPPGTDRRELFARWLTAPDNRYFARSMANRIWSYFFSRGIIDPVDDLNVTNPPINPALLEALTQDFVKSGYDFRHVVRTILSSRVYQLSSRPNAFNTHDTSNFSRAIPRRVPAETLLDCLAQATGVFESFPGAPAGFRAAQLPDPAVPSDFLDLFGRPARNESCECERSADVSMLHALNLINGQTILARVSNPNGTLAALLKQNLPDEKLIEELYLLTLCRLPRPEETAKCIEHLKSYEKRDEAAQDLMWALLNGSGFLFVQ